jgi:hypothetical protein
MSQGPALSTAEAKCASGGTDMNPSLALHSGVVRFGCQGHHRGESARSRIMCRLAAFQTSPGRHVTTRDTSPKFLAEALLSQHTHGALRSAKKIYPEGMYAHKQGVYNGNLTHGETLLSAMTFAYLSLDVTDDLAMMLTLPVSQPCTVSRRPCVDDAGRWSIGSFIIPGAGRLGHHNQGCRRGRECVSCS